MPEVTTTSPRREPGGRPVSATSRESETAPALTATEQAQLVRCEDVISRGMETFVEVGRALAAVRDQRLYRVTHERFEDYCREQWNLDRTYAHRMIDAARVAEVLAEPVSAIADTAAEPEPTLPIGNTEPASGPVSPIGDTAPEPICEPVRVTNEAQARELAPLLPEPDKLRDAAQLAHRRSGGKPTAADFRAAREEVRPADEALSRYIEESPEVQLAHWRKNFMAAIARMTSVRAFTPEQVAANAGDDLLGELDRAYRDMGDYVSRVTKASGRGPAAPRTLRVAGGSQ